MGTARTSKAQYQSWGGLLTQQLSFSKARAVKAEFGMSDEQLRAASGPYAAEIIPSVAYTKFINKLAGRLSVRNHCQFPLCYGDFDNSNVIVDDKYHVLGVID
jgi:hypothetical protein